MRINLQIPSIDFYSGIVINKGIHWGIEGLEPKELEWFLGKSGMKKGTATEEFYAYLSIQIASVIYVSEVHGFTPYMPYFFLGDDIKRLSLA
jgi:hypothetical protein